MSRRLQQLVFWMLLLISGEQLDGAVDLQSATESNLTVQLEA